LNKLLKIILKLDIPIIWTAPPLFPFPPEPCPSPCGLGEGGTQALWDSQRGRGGEWIKD
jgi:hypothetical protein